MALFRLTITIIAFDCGFNSSSQFTNIFKKYTGFTPKDYRTSKNNVSATV
ncbi:MAG: helix-turn-helix transcriptional regulator [Ruminococcaceae bacterium]|nr:helix-turn-helix transcriptional regulator [Oscillospiraceae bacterium]